MGRVFIFCFYFQQFKNITQTSSILLFWQTNNTIVLTLSTGRIHGTICLEHNCTLNRLAYPYNFGVRLTMRPCDCCQFPYDLANLWYFWKVFGSGPSFHCGSVYYRSYRHFRLLNPKSIWNVNIIWLYHVPFTICVVSVLKIAFCDQKKSLTIISTYYFFSSILRFLTKRGRQVWLKLTRTVFSLVAMLNFYFRFRLISHLNVCQNSSASPARLKT
jgi:hypothetical protein